MRDDHESGQGLGGGANGTRMMGWLGFFLLVFAVAGLALYLGGESGQVSKNGGPALATQQPQ